MHASMLVPMLRLDNDRMVRGTVVWAREDCALVVSNDAPDTEGTLCDRLQVNQFSTQLGPGDPVLCWLPSRGETRGVVLGRIGPSQLEPVAAAETSAELEDELVIKARKNLTLKCGEGSITIREDGKILIKGKDLVSHAQRMNRIKGGSVSIN